MDVCRRCFVSGKVQGIFFRASARHEAEQLGISGYARNLSDGRVEVLACGTKSSVDQFSLWLSKGPQQAQVINLSCESVEIIPPATFTVE